MTKFLLSIVMLLTSFVSMRAQDIRYARNLMEKLCSKEFYGRGYSLNGGRLACNFLLNEIKNNNLKPLYNTYTQDFPITVNTFEGEMTVKINGSTLKPAEDYLVTPVSKGFYGNIVLKEFNPRKNKNLIKKIKNNKLSKDIVLVYDTTGLYNQYKELFILAQNHNQKTAGIEIKISDRTTGQSISCKQQNFTTLIVNKNKIVNNIDKNQLEIKIDAKLKNDYITSNLLFSVEGEIKDTFLLLTAHYDHIGTLGKDTYFPGAHDNASGTVMLMDLAKYFNLMSNNGNKPHYSLAFIIFSGEETGLLGSHFYTRHPVFPLSQIKLMLNLDMLGSGDEGIMAVNATENLPEYEKFVKINNSKKYLPKVDKRGPAANSDHYFFYKKGVKALYFYTMGQYKEYHNIYDKAEKIPMPAYQEIFNLIKDYIESE
ncbi:MAG: M28 family peptidase [Bacteroidales bacterium]|nr:M28 family peptidase [Bacteroidales bacterium]